MIFNNEHVLMCMFALICSGCQKKDISRIYKEIQASSLTDQISASFFDEDLHEFVSEDEVSIVNNGIIDSICQEGIKNDL